MTAPLLLDRDSLSRRLLGLMLQRLGYPPAAFATDIASALAASAGGLLFAPVVHEVGLSIAILIGAVALGRGVMQHGYMMPISIGALAAETAAPSATAVGVESESVPPKTKWWWEEPKGSVGATTMGMWAPASSAGSRGVPRSVRSSREA